MAQMTIESTARFSYNGSGANNSIATFKNPSNSERAEISSLVIYLGSVKGTCTWGDVAYGDGGSFSTYITINNVRSSTVTVNNTVGTYTGSGGTTADLSDTRPYTFTFNSPVSVGAGASATIYIRAPSVLNNKVMAFNGKTTYNSGSRNPNGRAIVLTYTNIPNIAPQPSNVRIECTDWDATNISWKVTANGPVTNYEIYRDNIRISTQNTSSTTLTGTMTGVTSSFHNIYAKAKNSNSAWVNSNVVTVDCTIPPINNASIKVTSTNQGILNFTSTYQVQYLLDNALLGTLNAGSLPNKIVTLKNNSLSPYVLRVWRTDNVKITNKIILNNVDTRVAILNLSLTIQGTQVDYNCKANYTCRTWQYRIYNANMSIIKTGTITTGTVVSVTTELSQEVVSELQFNTPYYLQVTAITNNSGLLAESNLVMFTLQGVGRIWNGQTWKNGTAYVYYNGNWTLVIPYIYDGKDWVMCE